MLEAERSGGRLTEALGDEVVRLHAYHLQQVCEEAETLHAVPMWQAR